jgi:hypothetical protein
MQGIVNECKKSTAEFEYRTGVQESRIEKLLSD